MQVSESRADRQVFNHGARCTVCDHEQLSLINTLLASGAQSNRAIASQFSLNRGAIDRHSTRHLPAKLAKALERAENKEADEFLDGILSTARLMGQGVAHGMSAIEDGLIEAETAYKLVPAMAAQQLRALELLGQATGRLNQAGAATTAVHLHVVMPRELACEPKRTDANQNEHAIDGQCKAIESKE